MPFKSSRIQFSIALFAASGVFATPSDYVEPQWNFSAGGSSALVLAKDGRVQCWGANGSGQLGLGDKTNRTSPDLVYGLTNWRDVDIGKKHSIGIWQGRYSAWGDNQYGQLGDGTTNNTTLPDYSSMDEDWMAVCVGTDHSAGIKVNGDVYTWGRNNYGQLGVNAPSNYIRTTPTLALSGFSIPFKSISCGDNHTMAIRSDGTLWGWGYNAYGNLGDNTSSHRFTPVQAGLANGTSTRWISVDAGATHTVGRRGEGAKAYAWGNNAYGQLGDGTTTLRRAPKLIAMPQSNHIVEIVAGGEHTLAVTVSGGLWSWGRNGYGQLGDNSAGPRLTPARISNPTPVNDWISVRAGDDFSLGLRVDGTVMSWGRNSSGQLGRVVNGTYPAYRPAAVLTGMRLRAFGTARFSTFLLENNGTLYSCGGNATGALGLGDYAARGVPTQIVNSSPASNANNWRKVNFGQSGAADMGAGIRAGGYLWTWGLDSRGVLGNGPGTTHRLIPTRIGSVADSLWVEVSCNYFDCLALKSNGTLWSWGETYHGNGQGVVRLDVPTQVGTENTWVAIGAGEWSRAAIKSDGSLWVWGQNDVGQLGLNHYSGPVTTPTQASTAGYYWKSVGGAGGSMMALRADGALYGWGRNDLGQLGVGHFYPSTPHMTAVGGNLKWRQFSSNGAHIAAVSANNLVFTWGSNYHGTIGDGYRTYPGLNYDRPSPYPTVLGRVARAGNTVSLVIDSGLWGWGAGGSGQLGDGLWMEHLYPSNFGP